MTNAAPSTKTYLTAGTIAPTHSVEDITFGVEVETFIPASSDVNVGGYYSGRACRQLPRFGRTHWQAKYDGSLRASNNTRGMTGCEFVSPILKGSTGLANTKTAVEAIRDLGAKVNGSCGVHVHVGVPTDLDRKSRARFVKALTYLVGKVEGGLYASTGTPRRETGGWAAGCKNIAREQGWNDETIATGRMASQRYHGLNITNLTGYGHGTPTVEFRYFSETTNPEKVTAWVAMCVSLVQIALTSPKLAKPDVRTAKHVTLIGSGQGERELNRLFYTIGWTKGKCRYYGVGVFNGFDTKNFKKTLRGLARKYDGR